MLLIELFSYSDKSMTIYRVKVRREDRGATFCINVYI